MAWADLRAEICAEFSELCTLDRRDITQGRLSLSDDRVTSRRTDQDVADRILTVAATRVRWQCTELAQVAGTGNREQCGKVLAKSPDWRRSVSCVWVSTEQRYRCLYYWVNDQAILRCFADLETVTLTHEYVHHLLGVEPQTVTRVLSRYGWTRSRKKIKQHSSGRFKYVWTNPRVLARRHAETAAA